MPSSCLAPYVRCVEDVTFGNRDRDFGGPPRSAGLKGKLGVAITDDACDSLIWFLPSDKALWCAAVTKVSGPDAWHIPRAWVRPDMAEEYDVDWGSRMSSMRVGAKVQVTMGSALLDGTVVEIREYDDGNMGHVGVLIDRTSKVWFVHPNLIANDAWVVGVVGR